MPRGAREIVTPSIFQKKMEGGKLKVEVEAEKIFFERGASIRWNVLVSLLPVACSL